MWEAHIYKILIFAGLFLPLLMIGSTVPAAAQVAGGAFKDCPECPEMVVIPAGSFLMGSSGNKANAPGATKGLQPDASEMPQHNVTLRAFALGKYEVTQEQWVAVMGENPSAHEGPTLPVERVSWNAAKTFIERLSAKTGKLYRLPTESEWEYAARAGSTSAYAFGDDDSELKKYGWYEANSGMATHPVGQKPPNTFGLYDMYGNVWEWVQDCYRASYVGAPADGGAAAEEASCDRVNRGGAWYDDPEVMRSAYRFKDGPDNLVSGLGFRVARALQ